MSSTGALGVDAVYELGKSGAWAQVLANVRGRRARGASLARYVKPSSGWGLLHQASWWGASEAARVLIGYGAVVDRKDKDGKTPADVAEERGHSELASELTSAVLDSLWSWPPGAEALADHSLFPSSSRWDSSSKFVVSEEFSVAYAGGRASALRGMTVYLDAYGRVLVGWHGTISLPCGMDGMPMVR